MVYHGTHRTAQTIASPENQNVYGHLYELYHYTRVNVAVANWQNDLYIDVRCINISTFKISITSMCQEKKHRCLETSIFKTLKKNVFPQVL